MPSYRIEWIREAVLDKKRLIQRLKKEYPPGVEKAERLILDAIDQLIDNPERGKPCQDEGCEEFRDLYKRFGKNSYTIRYRIGQQIIFIAGIWHGRENR